MSTCTKQVDSPAWRDLTAAVIGYGSIGRRHAENLRSLGIGRLILARRSANANPAFPVPAEAIVVHDVQTALEMGVDLAIVCTPTRLHPETALPFLRSGVSVLIEKPLAAEIADARRLQAAAAKHETPCGMAYCMRYHPAYALAREIIQEGRIGRVLYAKSWFESWLPSWHPWEDYRQSYAARRELGGGVLPTLDHEIDFLCWCLGPPRRVTGVSHRSGALALDVDDSAALMMEFAGGTTASCQLSLCRQDRQRGFEFVGSQATLRYSLESNQLRLRADSMDDEETAWDGQAYDTNDMYRDLLVDFLAAVVRGDRPPVPLEAGVEALEICQQVQSRSEP